MLKKFIVSAIGVVLGLGVVLGFVKTISKSEVVEAYTKKAVVEWDEDLEIIYANQNSLLIVEDGVGTTVFLDFAKGENISNFKSSGDGVLGENDISLYSLYQRDPSKYSVAPPADGADLSNWSIVFGSKNPYEDLVSSPEMKVTMLGGSIKTIYPGNASFSLESATTLLGPVTMTMTGGSVETIYTDQGYIHGFEGKRADSSIQTTFNLFGGTVETLTRTNDKRLVYHTRVNFKGSVVINNVMPDIYSNNEYFALVGDLEESAKITFTLDSTFLQSDNLFITTDPSFIDRLNLNLIKLANIPDNAFDWVIYKNEETVKFGKNTKITSVKIVGNAKVGETLTVQTTPAGAAFHTCSWNRKDDVINQVSWVGSGDSYTLKDADGGKKIVLIVIDKNYLNNVFEIELDSVVERRESPEIETVGGKSILYANGYDILVVKDGAGTTIYLDYGEIGKLDTLDKSLADAMVENAPANGSDLRGFVISMGSSVSHSIGANTITVLGGEIDKITTISKVANTTNDYIVFNLFGGKIGMIEPRKDLVQGKVYIRLGGAVSVKILVAQNKNNTDSLSVAKMLKNASIKLLVDDTAKVGDVVVIAENLKYLDLNQFEICDKTGNVSTKFSLEKTNKGLVLKKYSPNKNCLPVYAIVLIVFGSLVVISGVFFVIWFILWKNQKVSAKFMGSTFEKVDTMLKKKDVNKKKNSTDEKSKPEKKKIKLEKEEKESVQQAKEKHKQTATTKSSKVAQIEKKQKIKKETKSEQ